MQAKVKKKNLSNNIQILGILGIYIFVSRSLNAYIINILVSIQVISLKYF